MIIAVASGKGGTGKTSVAAALARTWTRPCLTLDLDVEAPNLHLFLKPEFQGDFAATLTIPRVAHPEKCTGCNACSDLCAFKAVLNFGDFPVVFPEMCHGCEGCFLVCDAGVFAKDTRELGQVQWGMSQLQDQSAPFVMGRQRVGEAMSPPLIREALRHVSLMHRDVAAGERDMIIDAPPGASCPAMTAVQPADFVLLVTEPTPFGLHDLKIAFEAFCEGEEVEDRPVGVVINRSGGGGADGEAAIEKWCQSEGIPVLARLPYAQSAAEAYARQQTLDTVSDDYATCMQELRDQIEEIWEEEAAYAD